MNQTQTYYGNPQIGYSTNPNAALNTAVSTNNAPIGTAPLPVSAYTPVTQATPFASPITASPFISGPQAKPIDSSALTQTPAVVPPAQNAPSYNTISTATSIGDQATAYANSLVPGLAAEKTSKDSSLTALTNALLGQQGQNELTGQAYTANGVDSAKADVDDLNARILSERNANQNYKDSVLQNGNVTREQAGAITNESDRLSTSKQADLAVLQYAAQNKYSQAKDIADRAVDIKLEKDKQKIDALQFQYNENKADYTKDEQRQFESQQAERTRLLTDKKDSLDKIYALQAEVSKNGAPQDVQAAILKEAQGDNPNYGKAVAAAGTWTSDPLDRQAKLLDIQSKKADIANTYSQIADRNAANAPLVVGAANNPHPTVTLKAGDDPYNIAQQAGTDVATLQALNPGITDFHNIPVGTSLNLPLPAGQLSSDPQVDAYANEILSGVVSSIAQVPSKYKDAVSSALNQPGQNGVSPLAASRETQAATRITNQYTSLPIYTAVAGGQLYLSRIAAANKTPGSISDQDLLDSITKLNTGGQAVQDTQVKLITDGKSLSDVIGTWGNKVNNGGVLSPSQRTQLTKIANDVFTNYQSEYQPVYEAAVAQLKAAGVPQPFWTIPDLNGLNAAEKKAAGNTTSTSGGTYQDYLNSIK